MKKVLLGTLLVAVASWVVFPSLGYSTPDFSKKEGNAPCTKCHVKPMKGDENLNPVGKCYKDKKDLKACEAAK